MAKKKTKTRKQRKAEAAAKRQATAVSSGGEGKAIAEAPRPPAKKQAAKRPARKQRNAIQRLFYETRGELKKVSWPTREEAWRLTIVVTAVTVFMAAFLGFFDWLFTKLFALILG